MPTKNTIVVPCIVNNWLNWSGPTMALPGDTNCTRMASASMPPTIMNTIASTTYMTPIVL